ncbi:MAG: hypothetical protein CMJ33_01880 [Phycisphaerae bacterium]|nr:hypothetical protein [Phycisphaerae bacterium]
MRRSSASSSERPSSPFRYATFSGLVAAVLALGLTGCDSMQSMLELPEEPPAYPAQDSILSEDQHGGTHHCSLVSGRLWYQTFGCELLVLDVVDGADIVSLTPIEHGDAGALVDMIIDGESMYLIADGDALIELDLQNQRLPRVSRIFPSSELGIRPRHVAIIDDALWVSGDGGVVRLDRSGACSPVFRGDDPDIVCSKVVSTIQGPAVCCGRRIHRVDDWRYLGAASMLEPLPAISGLSNGFLFVLQGSEGASVGVMGSDLRQISDFAVRGDVRAIRFADARLWAIGEGEIGSAEVLNDGRLGPTEWISIKGARDLDMAGPNYLVVAGSFGRSIYRIKADASGAGDAFLAVTREPGRLDAAIDDGRRVLTGSVEGAWIYTIGDDVEIVDMPIKRNTVPVDFAAANWGDVRISDDRTELVIHVDDVDHSWFAPNDAMISTIAVMGRRIWVGHEEGVSLIRINGPKDVGERAYFKLPPPPRIEDAGTLRISSGVTHLLPVRVGDEVVWVSQFGGIGVAKAVRTKLDGWPFL